MLQQRSKILSVVTRARYSQINKDIEINAHLYMSKTKGTLKSAPWNI